MVKHIVVYTLKEGVDKDEAVKLTASKLEPWLAKFPDCSTWKSAAAMQVWTMPCIPSLRRLKM